MKRACGVFFLLLVVFNTIGYYGLLILVQQQLSTPVLQKIEANSNEIGGNLIFVVPLESSYSDGSNGYTDINGEVVYRGEVYRLVKQKIYNKMLYIVCVKDEQSTKARAELADYSKLFSGQQAEHADSNIKIINSLSKYYTLTDFSTKSENEGWALTFTHIQLSNLYQFAGSISIFHPPQFS